MPKKRKRPRRDPGPITGDPRADVLTTILNQKLKHAQRASQARWCLKHNMHMQEALRVLREIVAEPDKSMSKRSHLNMAQRALIRWGTPKLAYEEPTYLPKEWEGLISTCAIKGPVVWTDDQELVRRSMDKLK